MKLENFCCIGANLQNRQSDGKKQPQLFLYRSLDLNEKIEDMLVDGFFDAIENRVKVNDLILLFHPQRDGKREIVWCKVIYNNGGQVKVKGISSSAEDIMVDPEWSHLLPDPIDATNLKDYLYALEDALNNIQQKTFMFTGYVGTTDPILSSATIRNGDMWINSGTMPTTIPVPMTDIKIYNGTTWQNAEEDYIPQNFDTFRNITDDEGYYWFGGEWKVISTDLSLDYFTLNTTTGKWEIKSNVNLPGNPTTTNPDDSDNSNRLATTSFVKNTVDKLPPNYLTGFVITKTGSAVFSVSSGYARSMDNVRNIVLNNVINKNLGSFEVGNGGCMPDSLSLRQNQGLYVFAIANDGGTVDIIVDENANCVNGLADATVQANNFNKWVRIGEIRTNANTIEIVDPISYSTDFRDLKIRDLNLVPVDNNAGGGRIMFLSAPNEVNAGESMCIDRYDGHIRIIGVSSNGIKVLLDADAEIGDVEGNIGKTGMIYLFGGTTAPEGFLPCNGAAVSRIKYSRLFGIIGTTWGAGDGSTTFNLPKFIDRYPIGSGALNVGILTGQSLPNITGTVIGADGAWGKSPSQTSSGAFYSGSATTYGQGGQAGGVRLEFNASLSNNVYGATMENLGAGRVIPYSACVQYVIKY